MAVHQKTVVITGASSGIGQSCATALAAKGWRVFAGVRKNIDGESLKRLAPDNLLPVVLDVADEDSIAGAAHAVRAATGTAGLDGLVNNAGIAVGGPLEFVPINQMRRQMDVNVIGQIAVTQAFLPLLRLAQGHIILIGSVSGLCSLPLFGPYCASKFALEALADALRLELRPWGMPVSIVEPGATKTPIWEKSIMENRALMRGYPREAEALYSNMLRRLEAVIQDTSERAVSPAKVTEAVIHALMAGRPKARYLVGRRATIQLLVEALPIRLRDFILAKMLLEYPGPVRNSRAHAVAERNW